MNKRAVLKANCPVFGLVLFVCLYICAVLMNITYTLQGDRMNDEWQAAPRLMPDF